MPKAQSSMHFYRGGGRPDWETRLSQMSLVSTLHSSAWGSVPAIYHGLRPASEDSLGRPCCRYDWGPQRHLLLVVHAELRATTPRGK